MEAAGIREVYAESEVAGAAVGDELALGVDHAALGRGDAAADMDHFAFTFDRPRRGGERADEIDLEFERGRAAAGRLDRQHGGTRRRIDEGGGETAMGDAERVHVPCLRRYPVKHPAVFGLDQADADERVELRGRGGIRHDRL